MNMRALQRLFPSVLFSFEQVSRGITFTEGNVNNKRYTVVNPQAFEMCTCDSLKMSHMLRTCESGSTSCGFLLLDTCYALFGNACMYF